MLFLAQRSRICYPVIGLFRHRSQCAFLAHHDLKLLGAAIVLLIVLPGLFFRSFGRPSRSVVPHVREFDLCCNAIRCNTGEITLQFLAFAFADTVHCGHDVLAETGRAQIVQRNFGIFDHIMEQRGDLPLLGDAIFGDCYWVKDVIFAGHVLLPFMRLCRQFQGLFVFLPERSAFHDTADRTFFLLG